ncbi:MAG: hypothetical protein LBO69_09170 [Ignavibacteria bacterium]|jgi:hypothetical protein|nr:hypothetical protein [Ignavibacteria bacterium]
MEQELKDIWIAKDQAKILYPHKVIWHIIFILFTGGIGNILYAISVSRKRKKHIKEWMELCAME